MVNKKSASTPLEELQNQFSIIELGGEFRVVSQIQIEGILGGKNFGEPAFYKKTDSTIMMKRFLETLPYVRKPQIVISDFWISPKTVVYKGTAFTPKPSSPAALNFWVGPIAPDATGNAAVIFNHLLKVICDDDPVSFDYLIDYLAHMIQKPAEKPGVMIVMLGRQGTGKGMFFNLLRAIWPYTTLQVTDVEHVIGRFNACLERKYAVCMDEALFVGDRKALDRLKSLITETHINIEQKFQPARSIGSVHRFFAASNHGHFARVEVDDRRFVFLRVSDVYRQNTNYFAQLVAAISDPGTIGAFVHHLQNIDLTLFEVRKKPNSSEHLNQKIKSLYGFERYWCEVLISGDFGVGVNPNNLSQVWSHTLFMPTSDLIRHFISFDKNAQKHQTVQSAEVLANVLKLCPSAVPERKLYQSDVFGIKLQKRGVSLPDLATARVEFDRIIGGGGIVYDQN